MPYIARSLVRRKKYINKYHPRFDVRIRENIDHFLFDMTDISDISDISDILKMIHYMRTL